MADPHRGALGVKPIAPPPYREHRLPPGRHGIAATEVAANQRWRLLGAAAEVLAERGIVGTNARAIASRAAVSSSSFYAQFEDVDDVLAASFAAAAEALVEALAAACAEEPEPGAKIGAAIAAAFSFAAAEPALPALMRLELAVAVPKVRSSREGLSEELGGALELVRRAMPSGVGAHLVAAALALLSDRRGESTDLGVLRAELITLLG